ncbi:hypothetical protein ACFCXK_09635 [Streptomyces sp. NPDC056269]|uniref:hypothetical protein n=1 Tax=Streptomyces sp. NPDC056269 TaxID=3345768 RepID=UPI0035DEC428
MARQGNPDANQATAWTSEMPSWRADPRLTSVPVISAKKNPALARLKRDSRLRRVLRDKLRALDPLAALSPPSLADQHALLNAARSVLGEHETLPSQQPAKIKLVIKSNGRRYTLTVDAEDPLGAATRQQLRQEKLAELERIAEDTRLDASLAHYDTPMPRDVVRALGEFIRSNPPVPPLRRRRR